MTIGLINDIEIIFIDETDQSDLPGEKNFGMLN